MNCKICNSNTAQFGFIDAGRHCNLQHPQLIPTKRAANLYLRCNKCQFIFTSDYDHFTHEQWKNEIYNADYHRVDPPYEKIRPKNNARIIRQLINECSERKNPRILDYGSGSGVLKQELDGVFKIDSYDPYVEMVSDAPTEKFDLVFCSEVFEHVTDPHHTLASIKKLLLPEGIILFTTSIQPDEVTVDWHYIAPRNGHVSIYSKDSLRHLLESYHLNYVMLNSEWHMASADTQRSFLDCAKARFVIKQHQTDFIFV